MALILGKAADSKFKYSHKVKVDKFWKIKQLPVTTFGTGKPYSKLQQLVKAGTTTDHGVLSHEGIFLSKRAYVQFACACVQ